MRNAFQAIKLILVRSLFSSLLYRKKIPNQAFVGVLIPILGVAVGVFAFTVVLSIMGGFVHNLKGRLLALQPHIELQFQDEATPLFSRQEYVKKITQLSLEILSISAYQRGSVILSSPNNRRALMALLEGIEPRVFEEDSELQKYLTPGSRFSSLEEQHRIQDEEESDFFPTVILGYDLMRQLGLFVGDRATMISTQIDAGPFGLAPEQFPVVISGALSTGHFAYDQKVIFTSFDVATQFLQRSQSWSGFYLRIKNPFQVEEFISAIEPKLSALGLLAKPWTEANKPLLKALMLEHWGMSFVLGMTLLVGCFSITISLLLAVRRKAREMAILRSLGLEKKELGLLFLLNGFFVGIMGISLGLLAGFSVLYFVSHFPIPFVTAAYNKETLPVLVQFSQILSVSVGSLVLAILAAVWPAIEVMKLDVVKTLSERN